MRTIVCTVVASLLVLPAVAIAQTVSPPLPPSIEKAPAPIEKAPSSPGSPRLSLTDAQIKEWINKAVYSSDNRKLGSVAAIKTDASGGVTEMHADVGGFLGIGENRVRLMPNEFLLSGDRVVLTLSADQAKGLPKVEKTKD